VDLGGRRVLVDPCFAEDLGASVLYRAARASIEPEETGDVDVICVSAHEPGAFDGASTRRLRGRSASCFVADEATAKILRFQGYKRVRVVVPGDVFETRDVTVRMSPSGALLAGAAVGFHVARGGRALWHAGSPPPLDVSAASAQFARENPADVVAVSALGLSFAGAQRTVDREDALLLAALARARYAVFLDDDVGLSALGGLVLKSEPGRRRPPPGARVRPIVVEEGRWYRVLSS
jgi:L-ascorbate metabolism protein UlaG (beta-lactamase superfamily)